jgi:peroxiredoxin
MSFSTEHSMNQLSNDTDAFALPSNIPAPSDDGAASHLQSTKLPLVSLPSTSDSNIDISGLPGLNIIFCYPRTAAPGETVPDEWNSIPGARGCTPQACGFRDASDDFKSHGVEAIYGVSTQSTAYQQELRERVKLSYELLSDEKLQLVEALKLPTMEWEGKTLIKRLAMAVEDGKVVKVWYPVFPPDRNAGDVLEWLKSRSES